MRAEDERWPSCGCHLGCVHEGSNLGAVSKAPSMIRPIVDLNVTESFCSTISLVEDEVTHGGLYCLEHDNSTALELEYTILIFHQSCT